MADEQLGFYIDVETGAAKAREELGTLPAAIDEVVGQVNTGLSKLGAVAPFEKVMADAQAGVASIEQVNAAASQLLMTFRLLSSANEQLASLGASFRFGAGGGAPVEQLQKQTQELLRQGEVMRQNLALQQEMAAAQAETVIPANRVPGGIASQAELDANAAASASATNARRQAEAEATAKAEATENARIHRSTISSLNPVTQGGAIIGQIEEGAVRIKGAFIEVARDITLGGEQVQAGIYRMRNGERLSQLEEFAYLQKNSATQAAFGAGGFGGGGGFFTGFGHGLFGAGGEGGLNEFGQLAGNISKYILIFQIFRDIEKVIRDSVEQTLMFERAITDLSNVLQISRDEAASLATNLANTGAVAGLSPAQSVALGGQFATTFAGQGTPAALAQQGVDIGSQIKILVGSKETTTDLRDTTAAVQSFNLTAADTSRVLDAATSAAQHFGLANAGQVLPGLAQIGDLAEQAGFSVEFTANALADITARTGETSDAAAGELRRFLGREGNTAFQQVFTQQGISTNQSFSEELSQLSAKYSTLNDQQKAFITGEFGGGRAGAAALVFLEDYNKIQTEANKSTAEGGIAQQQYFARLNDVRGILATLHGDFDLLAKDIGETGIGSGIGLILTTLRPILATANDVLGTFEKIPAPLRDAGFLMAEILLVSQGIAKLGIGERLAGVFGGRRGAAAGAAAAAGGGALGVENAAAVDAAMVRLQAALQAGAITQEEYAAAIRQATETGSIQVTEAFNRAAEGITVAGEELTGALAHAAEKISVGADEVAAAETAGAAKIAAGATEEAIAEASGGFITGLRGALGTLKGQLGSLFSSPLFVGIAGAVAIDTAARGTSNILKYSDAAGSDVAGGVTPDQLRNTESRLRNEAARAAHSSAGISGSIINAILGDPTGAAAAHARQQADLADAEAKQYEAATNAGASTNNLAASMVDLSNAQNGLSDSFTALSNQGFTATQSVQAVIDKLRATDLVSQGNGVIPPGALLQVAAGASHIASSQFGQQVQGLIDLQNLQGGGGGFHIPGINLNPLAPIIHGARALANDVTGAPKPPPGVNVDALRAVNMGEFNAALNTSIAGFFRGQGLSEDQAGRLSPAQLKAEQTVILNAEKANLAKQGVDHTTIMKLLPQLNLNAASAVRQQFNAIAGGIAELSPGALAQDLKSLQQQIAAADAEAQNSATLSGAAGGGQLAGAKQGLSFLQQWRQGIQGNKNLSPEVRARDLAQVNVAIQAQQVAVQQAIQANIDADNQLAQSLVSPFDASGGLQTQMTGLRAKLAATTDSTARKGILAQINQLKFQMSQQAVTDANAAEDATIAGGDAVGKAQAQYDDALRTYNLIVSEGVTQGAQFSQALLALNEGRQAVIDAEVDQSNALADSLIDPRNKTGTDAQSIRDILNKLASTPQFGANGQQTSQYSQLVTQLNQARVQQQQDQVAQTNAIADANVSPQRPIMGLITQLQDARRNLAIELPGTVEYANTLKQIRQLQVQIAQSMTELGNARAVAGIDPRNTIALAAQAVRNDRDVLANDARFTTKYYQDLTTLHQAEHQLEQDRTAKINAARDANVRSGDALAAAHASLADARRTLRDDERGTAQYYQDLQRVHESEAALAKAIADRAKQNFLLGSDTTDPVAQAEAALVAAQTQRRQDRRRKTGDLGADRLGVEEAQWSKQQALFDQRLSDQQTAYQLQDESTAQYLHWLEAQDHALRNQLAGMKKGSEGYRQLTDELNQVDEAIKSITGDMAGQFNLGDIKVPTVYDVRRSIAQSASVIDASTTNNQVYINGVDMNAVINYINSILGPGAATRSPTAKRKVHA